MIRHAFTAAALLAVLLAAALNLRAPMPPLQDFNEWIYQGWLIGQIMGDGNLPFGIEPPFGIKPSFGIKPWPVPNAAVQAILGLLNLPLGPRAAGVAFLCAYLVGATWLAAAIARAQGRFQPDSFLLALLIGGLNSPYWDGYANSQLGVGLYLVHVLRQRRGPTTVAWDLALGLALFFCHAVMLAVFALHLVVHAWQRRAWRRAVGVLAPPFALLAWYVLRDENYGEQIPPFGTSAAEFVAYKAYTAAKSGPYQNFVIGGVGDADRAPALYWAGVALNLAFVALALIPLALALVRQLRRGDRSPALLTALACLGGYAVLPSSLFGVVNIGERLLIPAMLVILALCPDPWRLRRFGASLAALSPAMLLYLHIILPAAPPDATSAPGIGHLAAHDPHERSRLLFWHRPFQFQAQFAAALAGTPVRLGFTTSLVRPLVPQAVAP